MTRESDTRRLPPMDEARFRAIVDAYGADEQRWPHAERAAAQAWANAHRSEAHALLETAARLDDWLDRYEVAPATDALHRRIVGRAPVRVASRAHTWWSGAALAGVGLLGGLTGALAVSFFVLSGAPEAIHASSYDATYLTTSFGGSAADWSGQ